jgi:transposase-like protein
LTELAVIEGDKPESTYKAAQNTALAKRPLKSLPAEKRAQIALEVLQAYEQGEEIADLAPEYGVSDVTLYALLVRDHEEAWKSAQVSRALANKARVNKDLSNLRIQLQSKTQEDSDSPHDALSLARIKEQIKLAEVQAKRAEWELERVYRRVYGQDASPDQAGRVSITLNIGAKSGEGTTVEGEYCTAVDAHNELGQNNESDLAK